MKILLLLHLESWDSSFQVSDFNTISVADSSAENSILNRCKDCVGEEFEYSGHIKLTKPDYEYVYTMKYGKEAIVYARKHWKTNRWFLTTEPDGLVENNLDFLPTFY